MLFKIKPISMIFIQITSLTHAFWIENAVFMRAFGSIAGPSILSVAGWAHVLGIVFSIGMRAICVHHYRFRMQTDQVWQINWWFNFFTFYFPIDCFNINMVGNCMGTANVALFATRRRTRMRFLSLISTTGKLRLLYLTLDTRLPFLTFSTVDYLVTTSHFISFFAAKRKFHCLQTTLFNFIATYGQLFTATLLFLILFLLALEYFVSCFLRIHYFFHIDIGSKIILYAKIA